jgi:ABC-2 type transport system ATP-binding protein
MDVRDGEVLCLVGLNGAGKTTIIRMTSGIILPSRGNITIDGYNIVSNKVEASRRVGWVPEFPNFEPNAKPLPLMRYFAGYYNLKGKEAEQRIKESLESVGLSDYLDRKLSGYSQGMKKRFSIAESLIGDPQNILFDETFNGLDPEGVVFVRNRINNLRKIGKAIMLSSHILTEVEGIADRVAIISHGKLLKILNRNELKNLGRDMMFLVVDNPDERITSILKKFGEPAVNGTEITLKDLTVPRERYSEVPSELVKEGYMIGRFQIAGESLEEYFFSLVGEKL